MHYIRHQSGRVLEREREREIQCFETDLISINRGGRMRLMVLESLFTASRHFGLSVCLASFFFSSISSTCSTTCLHHFIFGRPRLLKNPTLLTHRHYPSSKHVHTLAFCLLWLVCPKFLPNPPVLGYTFSQLI